MHSGSGLSVCLRGFPGANRALVNPSRLANLGRHITLASPDPNGAEAQFVAELCRAQHPRLVVFGGWSPLYAALVEHLRDEPIRFAVLWTSSPGQTGLSCEGDKLDAIVAERRIGSLLFTSRSFAETFAGRRPGVYHLPLALDVPPSESVQPAATTRRDGPFEVTLFCAAPEYARKNVLNCLLALAGVRGDYRLVVNGLSRDPHYGALLERLEIPWLDHGWMERPHYDAAVARAQLGLQVSFAESYCYVAAEHLLAGVPVLASPMVPALDPLSPPLRERFIVSSPEAVDEIREKVQFLLDRPTLCAELGLRAREELLAANARDAGYARRLLTALVEGVEVQG
jgi:glycosyltransferase involved in cell wall biosynthesis